MIRDLLKWGADAHHMVERFGIFTIIVLGEAFVKVLDDAQGTALGIEQILFGVVGIGVLYTLWWLYFSDTAGKLYDESVNVKPLAWSYGHLFLAASLVAFWCSCEEAVLRDSETPDGSGHRRVPSATNCRPCHFSYWRWRSSITA